MTVFPHVLDHTVDGIVNQENEEWSIIKSDQDACPNNCTSASCGDGILRTQGEPR